MIKRGINIKLAILFGAFSLLLILGASYFFYAASSVGATRSVQLLAEQCVKDFEAIGVKANIRPQDHAIVSYQPNTGQLQDRVNSSSIGIARCAGFRLVEFCAGNGCPKPGVFFVLENL